MNAQHKVLPAVCCIALLSACASNQGGGAAAWTIKPTAVTKNSSDKPEAMYQLGRYYQGQNRFDEAIHAYLKALHADADFVEARNGLGVVYSKQGKYREAITAFQAAIQQAPQAAHLYSNMGHAYYLQGQYTESIQALQQATALDPDNQRAFNNLGLAYAKAGNSTASALAFAEAISVEKPAPVVAAAPTVTTIAVASVADAKLNAVEPEAQMLAIPKDRGVIRTANAAPLVLPLVESRIKLVQLAPNVSELQIRAQSAAEVQMVALENPQELLQLRLEVANGNGVSRAAGKVGKFLRGQGYAAARLTNQKPFNTQITQIQYRSGYEAQAQLLQFKLLDSPQLVQRNDLRANVRVVLGKDMVSQLARYEYKAGTIQLALNITDSGASVQQMF